MHKSNKQIFNLKYCIKDPLLIAILDKNGRVNGQEYSLEDLRLININQIYNIEEKREYY
jgi:hypothetical protein